MNKKKSVKSAKKMRIKNEKVDVLLAPLVPMPSAPYNGEVGADFDRYVVVYSNNVTGNQQSVWRAGETTICCYKQDTFVGAICFYETKEAMNGGYVDANGVIVVEYPISRLADVLRLLETISNPYLIFVERDNQGAWLRHPVGAIMTGSKKTVGTH